MSSKSDDLQDALNDVWDELEAQIEPLRQSIFLKNVYLDDPVDNLGNQRSSALKRKFDLRIPLRLDPTSAFIQEEDRLGKLQELLEVNILHNAKFLNLIKKAAQVLSRRVYVDSFKIREFNFEGSKIFQNFAIDVAFRVRLKKSDKRNPCIIKDISFEHTNEDFVIYTKELHRKPEFTSMVLNPASEGEGEGITNVILSVEQGVGNLVHSVNGTVKPISLDALTWLCEQYLRKNIFIANVFSKFAFKYNENFIPVQMFCVNEISYWPDSDDYEDLFDEDFFDYMGIDFEFVGPSMHLILRPVEYVH